MKPIVYIIENPGLDISSFIKDATLQFKDYDFYTTIDKTDYHLVEGIVHVKQALSGSYLSQFPHLKFIATAFTGYDSVDADYCIEKGIAVYNVPEYSTNSVAELTLGLAISMLRNIPAGGKTLESGKWNMEPGRELSGKTVAIIGTGAIGCRVATLFNAFGCKVVGWSRSKREAFLQIGGIYASNIEAAIKEADIVSIHLPSNKETKGIIGEAELAVMEKEAFLINTARGPVVNEKALIKALQENVIAGAALDVFDIEPLNENHPLRVMDNVIATPHIAYKTKEALQRKGEITIQNIKRFLSHDTTNKVL